MELSKPPDKNAPIGLSACILFYTALYNRYAVYFNNGVSVSLVISISLSLYILTNHFLIYYDYESQ